MCSLSKCKAVGNLAIEDAPMIFFVDRCDTYAATNGCSAVLGLFYGVGMACVVHAVVVVRVPMCS